MIPLFGGLEVGIVFLFSFIYLMYKVSFFLSLTMGHSVISTLSKMAASLLS